VYKYLRSRRRREVRNGALRRASWEQQFNRCSSAMAIGRPPNRRYSSVAQASTACGLCIIVRSPPRPTPSNSAARRRAFALPNRFRYRQQTRSLSRPRRSLGQPFSLFKASNETDVDFSFHSRSRPTTTRVPGHLARLRQRIVASPRKLQARSFPTSPRLSEEPAWMNTMRDTGSVGQSHARPPASLQTQPGPVANDRPRAAAAGRASCASLSRADTS